MRVQDPLKYAEVLLSYASPRQNYTAASIHRMLGGEEQQIDFRTQIPVHITYQTAFVDDSGKLQFRGQKLRRVASGGVPSPFALFEQLFR
jgi:murein L,D-transpeptidase YcbB/YkuD